MNDTSIYDFIETELVCELDDYSYTGASIRGIAENLADRLKSNGYCTDPYFAYEKALICPLNKRKDTYCGHTHCESHEFCMLLRKEGYV